MDEQIVLPERATKNRILFALSAFFLVLAVAIPMRSQFVAGAADHTDSPVAIANPLLDVTDLYAFRDNNDLILSISTNPVTNQPATKFSPGDFYVIFIDNNGDNVADVQYNFEFDGASPQNFICRGLPNGPVSGTVSANTGAETIVSIPSGGSIFCGLRDDPFFFDLVGFQAFTTMLYLPDNGLRLNSTNGTPADTFAGGNVSSIVMRVPITDVNGVPTDPNMGSIRVWSKTFSR